MTHEQYWRKIGVDKHAALSCALMQLFFEIQPFQFELALGCGIELDYLGHDSILYGSRLLAVKEY